MHAARAGYQDCDPIFSATQSNRGRASDGNTPGVDFTTRPTPLAPCQWDITYHRIGNVIEAAYLLPDGARL
jgi:hypothetical protein